ARTAPLVAGAVSCYVMAIEGGIAMTDRWQELQSTIAPGTVIVTDSGAGPLGQVLLDGRSARGFCRSPRCARCTARSPGRSLSQPASRAPHSEKGRQRMIDLYTAGTGNGFRAAIVLAESGLPHRIHKIDLGKGEQKTPEFLARNPAGAIPVLVDSEGPGGKALTLSQSGAIALYLAEKSGKFLPKDASRRALALQWFMQA